MAYVVTKPCLGNKDLSCVSVCPVDCFYDIRKVKFNEQFGVAFEGNDGDEKAGMLMIHPDECINCGACETECPVEAIYEDSAVPAEYQDFVKINEQETLGMTDAELESTRCTGK